MKTISPHRPRYYQIIIIIIRDVGINYKRGSGNIISSVVRQRVIRVTHNSRSCSQVCI